MTTSDNTQYPKGLTAAEAATNMRENADALKTPGCAKCGEAKLHALHTHTGMVDEKDTHPYQPQTDLDNQAGAGLAEAFQVEPQPEGLTGDSIHWVEYTHVVRFPVNAKSHNWFTGRAPESPADVREEVAQRLAHGQDVSERLTSRVVSPPLTADQLRKMRDAIAWQQIESD